MKKKEKHGDVGIQQMACSSYNKQASEINKKKVIEQKNNDQRQLGIQNQSRVFPKLERDEWIIKWKSFGSPDCFLTWASADPKGRGSTILWCRKKKKKEILISLVFLCRNNDATLLYTKHLLVPLGNCELASQLLTVSCPIKSSRLLRTTTHRARLFD